jgi:DNA-binding CsgD family transcriptional regulator
MPTVPRRPAAQRERDQLEARRLRAAELLAAGARQAEVALQLGVSRQAVSVWRCATACAVVAPSLPSTSG